MKQYRCKKHGEVVPYIPETGNGRKFSQCPECRRERGAARYLAKKEEMLTYHASWYKVNIDCERARHKEITRKLKLEVIAAYGRKCSCCGEGTPEFLTIDHADGGGRKHRDKILKAEGTLLYRWLKNHGFPQEGYRLLCWNCNCAIGRYGACPHQRTVAGKEAA